MYAFFRKILALPHASNIRAWVASVDCEPEHLINVHETDWEQCTKNWKHPIAYVLQNSCSAAVQSELIKDCIALLHAEGLKVVAVVIDRTYLNQGTAKKKLGCEFKVSRIKTCFPYPQDGNSTL